jgi:hypothetical protein
MTALPEEDGQSPTAPFEARHYCTGGGAMGRKSFDNLGGNLK